MKISTAKNYLCSSKNAAYFEPMSIHQTLVSGLQNQVWSTFAFKTIDFSIILMFPHLKHNLSVLNCFNIPYHLKKLSKLS